MSRDSVKNAFIDIGSNSMYSSLTCETYHGKLLIVEKIELNLIASQISHEIGSFRTWWINYWLQSDFGNETGDWILK